MVYPRTIDSSNSGVRQVNATESTEILKANLEFRDFAGSHCPLKSPVEGLDKSPYEERYYAGYGIESQPSGNVRRLDFPTDVTPRFTLSVQYVPKQQKRRRFGHQGCHESIISLHWGRRHRGHRGERKQNWRSALRDSPTGRCQDAATVEVVSTFGTKVGEKRLWAA